MRWVTRERAYNLTEKKRPAIAYAPPPEARTRRPHPTAGSVPTGDATRLHAPAPPPPPPHPSGRPSHTARPLRLSQGCNLFLLATCHTDVRRSCRPHGPARLGGNNITGRCMATVAAVFPTAQKPTGRAHPPGQTIRKSRLQTTGRICRCASYRDPHLPTPPPPHPPKHTVPPPPTQTNDTHTQTVSRAHTPPHPPRPPPAARTGGSGLPPICAAPAAATPPLPAAAARGGNNKTGGTATAAAAAAG